MRGNSWGARMGELTDDQLRQIAASRNAGISQSVRAAEAAGQKAQEVSSALTDYASSVASIPASVPVSHSHLKTWLLVGGVGLGAYFLLRRRRRRGRA